MLGSLTPCDGSDAQVADATRAQSPRPPSEALSHGGALRAKEGGVSTHSPQHRSPVHPQGHLHQLWDGCWCSPAKQTPKYPRGEEQTYHTGAAGCPSPGQTAVLVLPPSRGASLPPRSLFPSRPSPAASPHPAPAGLPTRRSLLPSGGSTGTYLSQEPTATSRAWPSPRGGAEGHPRGGQPRSTTTETSPAPHVHAVLAVAAGGWWGDEV